MEHPLVPVVTSFLLYRGNVLLLKRKAAAREFPSRYSGISGRIEEPHPYLQALKEIEEEVGISEEQLLSLCQGKPLTVSVSSIGKRFKVYPFLFQILRKPSIQLHSENASFLFVKPHRLPEPSVPKLRETFQRVYKGLFPYGRALAKIGRDTKKSASALLEDAVRLLEGVSRAERVRYQSYWETSLTYLRPEMAGFHLLSRSIFHPLLFLKRVNRYNRQSIRNCLAYLGKANIHSFTTYSASSLVAALALEAPWQWKKIICLTSYPEREGGALAKRLQREGLPAEVAPDSEAQKALQETDCLLVGCDALFSDGTLCHKAGTFPLALLAHSLKRKVVSLAPRQKRYPKSFLLLKERVSRKTGFDLTPSSLIDWAR